ncbi:pro-resilin-like [Cylas formicarius]|uniref:pro-resilin-like n=1 Tax=Cylas formicarius TaxID=197179 RepID=UPI002958AFF0|nr:pro-resilin-like [Cylas formicarius]
MPTYVTFSSRISWFWIFHCTYSASDDSFSFYKFTGPVSGRVNEVIINSESHPDGRKIDYVAQPNYNFHYGIQDTKTGNSQGHMESRMGDKVVGEYRVLQDDGMVRIVKYTADTQNGFQAHIEYVRLKY